MTQAIVVVVFVVLAMALAVAAYQESIPVSDPKAQTAYEELVRASSSLSKRDFLAIRAANKREQKNFGDGTHAPYWPDHKLNGHYTLHRGVWVEDGVARPSNRELDRVREANKQGHRIIRFTLVAGEQMAPFGKDGAMIRVVATAGIPSTVHDRNGQLTETIPSVSVSPVNTKEDGWWTQCFMGTLPVEMSVSVPHKVH